MNFITQFLKNDEAATAVEYAVMLALILVSVIGAIGTVGAGTGGLWSNIEDEVTDAMSP
jgi:pilus assembly protein Flp/PilA